MLPDLAPAHRRGPTFHCDRTQFNAIVAPSEPLPELIIIGKVIHQRLEAADCGKLLPSHGHYGAERKIQFPKTCALQHLAPEICVDGNGFPTQRQRRGIGEGIEAIHRSEEHTSELQSQSNLVCRLLLEKKKKKQKQ